MCYFVTIGASVPGRRLVQVFDEEAGLDVGALPVCGSVAKAFPRDDQVRMVTWRGCSCDLVGPTAGDASSQPQAKKLRATFRSCVARMARELGGVRLLVHRHGGDWGRPCELAACGSRRPLTVRELLSSEHWLIEDVLVEVTSGEGSKPLAV